MSATKQSTSDARLEARIPAELKRRAQRAAELKGMTLSSFVCQALWDEVEHTTREHEVMTLSERDVALFAETVSSPQEPNEALKEAARVYREQYGA